MSVHLSVCPRFMVWSLDVFRMAIKLNYPSVCPSVCISGLGGNKIFSAAIQDRVLFFMCRFLLHMIIYFVNILFVGLLVRLQKAEIQKYENMIFSIPN